MEKQTADSRNPGERLNCTTEGNKGNGDDCTAETRRRRVWNSSCGGRAPLPPSLIRFLLAGSGRGGIKGQVR